MVVCGDHGDHFVPPSFDDLFDQALVGNCKTEACPRVVVTSIDIPVSVGFRREE
jgi:hypothetical protein